MESCVPDLGSKFKYQKTNEWLRNDHEYEN